MNKADITNLIAVLVVAFGFSNGNEVILNIGLFALSGSLTNTLAIHMLFEKVPFLYGSGVIESKFEEFKASIKKLLMEQFFTKERLSNFFKEELKVMDFNKLLVSVDSSSFFDSLKSSVMNSPLGAMLNMLGGEKSLDNLKGLFDDKIAELLLNMTKSSNFQNSLDESLNTDEIQKNLSDIVDFRLNELSPKMVKDIVQNMIREHLSWLVLWGAVFGGLIGLLSSFLR